MIFRFLILVIFPFTTLIGQTYRDLSSIIDELSFSLYKIRADEDWSCIVSKNKKGIIYRVKNTYYIGKGNSKCLLLNPEELSSIGNIRKEAFNDISKVSLKDKGLLKLLMDVDIGRNHWKCYCELVRAGGQPLLLVKVRREKPKIIEQKCLLFFSGQNSVTKAIFINNLERSMLYRYDEKPDELFRFLDRLASKNSSIYSMGEVGAIVKDDSGNYFVYPMKDANHRFRLDLQNFERKFEVNPDNYRKLVKIEIGELKENWDEYVKYSVFNEQYWKVWFNQRPTLLFSNYIE